MDNQPIAKEGMLPIGTTLSNGKYKVERQLSSGGFGNTYIAIDTAFDERVAIKELYIKGVCGRQADSTNVSISLSENLRTFTAQQDKFRKEARRLRKLVNPHIIRVHDLFDENGTSYYVMDLVDGESLSQRMKRTGKPMTEQEVMLILPQVLNALEAVHAEGIWHLDLKPANIMLDRKGNALLIDFGASKQLRSLDGNSLSTSSALAYTPGYAPSEQMEQNIEKFGPWTDLYALGATLYHLLTQQQPPSPSDIDEDAEAALPIPSHISKKTRDLIFWLMKPNRKMRPQSVADVKQFLMETPSQIQEIKQPEPPKVEEEETLLQNNRRTSEETTSHPNSCQQQVGKTVVFPLIGVILIAVIIIGGGIAALSQSQCSIKKEVVDEDVDEDVDVDTTSLGSNQTFTANGVSFTMIYVQGGTFTMGATSEQGSDADSDEKPTHNVTLNSYHIGETEVTQALWQAVMGSLPSNISSSYYDLKGTQRPVCYVSWEDCQTFISRLNSLTGQQFHLPTEAQWEYAARGGNKSRGYKFSGSNDIDSVAWYSDNCGSKTHPIKTKSPNELGIYDMSGNVWEWCQDWYGSYSSSSQTNPTGPSSGSYRVFRGGSWYYYAKGSSIHCRSSIRNNNTPSIRGSIVGLRLAL